MENKDDFNLYARLESSVQMPMIENGKSRQDFQVSQSMQNVKDILAEVHQLDEAASQQDLYGRNDTSAVQMIPQDEARSENDLGFMTEVDPEYIPKQLQTGKMSQIETDQINSTRYSDHGTSMPQNVSTNMIYQDRQEFK